MKKGLVSIFCLLVLTITALPVGAQTRYRRSDRRYDGYRYEQRVQDYRYRDRVYNGGRYNRWDRDNSIWDRHRDKITTGIGAGAGAVIGSAVGGGKGAIIGAIVGGAGSALYTYKLRDRNRRRY